MEVRFENIGNGIERVIPVYSFTERVAPKHIERAIVDDAIQRRSRREREMTDCCRPFGERISPCSCMRNNVPMEEPHGIDIHVDRPLRQNFRTYGEWMEAMERYRCLEAVAKDCDWECREPMRTVERPMPTRNLNFSPMREMEHEFIFDFVSPFELNQFWD